MTYKFKNSFWPTTTRLRTSTSSWPRSSRPPAGSCRSFVGLLKCRSWLTSFRRNTNWKKARKVSSFIRRSKSKKTTLTLPTMLSSSTDLQKRVRKISASLRRQIERSWLHVSQVLKFILIYVVAQKCFRWR